MALNGLDLNLLVVLDVLLREQNVTRAAVHLNITQSAVSSALKRLRLALDDELLVLVGRKMQMTPRAQALKPKIAALIAQIEQTVAREAFDPFVARDRFVLGTADYATFVLMPAILKLLERAAPNVRLELVDLTEHCVDDMLAGKIDAIIAPRSYIPVEGLRSRTLFQEELVCVAALDHPAIIDGRIDLAAFKAAAHVRYQPGPNFEDGQSNLVQVRRQPDPSTILTCSSFAALTFMVGETSALAMVQERLARRFEVVAGLRILPAPMPTETLDIALFWAPNRNSDDAHVWFREIVAAASKGL